MASSSGSGPGSVIAGLLVAVAGLAPMIWAVTSGEPNVTTTIVAATSSAPATDQAPGPVTETIVVAPDPVEVDDLPESIVRALESAGNVREELPEQLGLPESVVNVLVAHDVVLRVAEGAAP